jgi:hypothetical protein
MIATDSARLGDCELLACCLVKSSTDVQGPCAIGTGNELATALSYCPKRGLAACLANGASVIEQL